MPQQPTLGTDYASVISLIDSIDPVKYGQTRNYVDGDVTYLSPYISRGVISTKQVLAVQLAKGYTISQMQAFVKELCWRDYFQRVGQVRNLNQPINQPQPVVLNNGIPAAIVTAQTGITAIDSAIGKLYATGYMHNHCRMYTAALACNIAKSHWHHPAQWLYYHLLDGDWASNACSWQWVAGANSSKLYFANQPNINKYTHSQQVGGFLDTSYEALACMAVPAILSPTQTPDLTTVLPAPAALNINPHLPTYLYNYYNLDPLWHSDIPANRVLLLEPDFFKTYPISAKCVDFMLKLSANISEIQPYVGSFESLVKTHAISSIHYKEHPLNIGYSGQQHSRDWIVAEVDGFYPSFFSYWKKIEKLIL